MALPESMRAIVLRREGENLTYGVKEIATPTVSGERDLIVKIEACPINPSDLGMPTLLSISCRRGSCSQARDHCVRARALGA